MSYFTRPLRSAFGLLLVISFACSNSQGQMVQSKQFGVMLQALLGHTVQEVSVSQAAAMTGALFLDAREQREYQVSHLAGARWVGYDQFDINTLSDLPRDTPLVVYCSVGYRSEKVTEKLLKAGFTQVSNLYGGIFEWVNEQQPLVDIQGTPTTKLHAYSPAWGVWAERGEKVYE